MLSALVVALGLGLWITRGPAEPEYQGVRLTFWLNECEKHFSPMSDRTPSGKAADAIRTMGTDAVPFLVRRAGASGFSAGWFLKKIMGGTAHRRTDDPRYIARYSAWTGFAVLGPAGEPAVPSLTSLLQDSDPEVRFSAALCLGYIGASASKAVPNLLRQVSDRSFRPRDGAVWALGEIRAEPERTIRLLCQVLATNQPGDPTTAGAAHAVSKFKGQARAAVPILLRLLETDPPGSRWSVLRALHQIDPELAKTLDPGSSKED